MKVLVHDSFLLKEHQSWICYIWCIRTVVVFKQDIKARSTWSSHFMSKPKIWNASYIFVHNAHFGGWRIAKTNLKLKHITTSSMTKTKVSHLLKCSTTLEKNFRFYKSQKNWDIKDYFLWISIPLYVFVMDQTLRNQSTERRKQPKLLRQRSYGDSTCKSIS